MASSNANADLIQNWTLKKVLDTIPRPAATASPSSPMAFLHIIERLKTTPREGWRRFEIHHGESIADHMYRMGIITMLCPNDAGINKDRCVKMALIHDVAEALVGDITPPDNIPSDVKHQRERESMDYITDLLKPLGDDIAREFLEIWLEYEEGTTKEAVFVKDVDRFELLVQTIEYEQRYDAQKDLSEFYHVRKGIKNDFVKKWADDAMKEREEFWASKGINNPLP